MSLVIEISEQLLNKSQKAKTYAMECNIKLECLYQISPAFLSVDFFKSNFFEKLFQEYDQSVKQFESRTGLIWVQTVCKSYQQTTLGDKELI